MRFKKIFLFQKRELDWWFFTLLPIALFLLFAIFLLIKLGFGIIKEILIMLIEQLLSYTVVLSSTDLGLKSKSIEKKYQIAPPLIIIFITVIALTFLYTNKESVINSRFIIFFYLIATLICTYFSIFLFNNNPESSDITPKTFTEAKEEKENEAKKLFESQKLKTNIKEVKWGTKK